MTSIVHKKVDFTEKQFFVTKFKNQDLKILFCALFSSVSPTLSKILLKVCHHYKEWMINLLAQIFKIEFIKLAKVGNTHFFLSMGKILLFWHHQNKYPFGETLFLRVYDFTFYSLFAPHLTSISDPKFLAIMIRQKK